MGLLMIEAHVEQLVMVVKLEVVEYSIDYLQNKLSFNS